MSTRGSPTKQINQTFVLETCFFGKIPILLYLSFLSCYQSQHPEIWNVYSIVVSNYFSLEAKHLTLASGLNLMMTSSCTNVSLFCVPRADILHFENEIRHVVLLKYSKLIPKNVILDLALETHYFDKINNCFIFWFFSVAFRPNILNIYSPWSSVTIFNRRQKCEPLLPVKIWWWRHHVLMRRSLCCILTFHTNTIKETYLLCYKKRFNKDDII